MAAELASGASGSDPESPGIPVVVDETIEPGTIEIRDGGETVGRIVGLGKTALPLPDAIRGSLPAEAPPETPESDPDPGGREQPAGRRAGAFATCTFCERRVDPNSSRTFRRVSGWERPRVGGGTNALALRFPQDEWACETCIGKKKAGLDPTQPSLYPTDN